MHAHAIVCSLICDSRLACALVCAPKHACALVCALIYTPKRVFTLICALLCALELLSALVCTHKFLQKLQKICLFLLYPSRALMVGSYADSSQLSYTMDTIIPGLG